MFSKEEHKRKQEQKEIEKLMSITDAELDKMSYKEKQKYYKLKCKLGRYSFVGNGSPYVKTAEK
jgi:hypothetical protein